MNVTKKQKFTYQRKHKNFKQSATTKKFYFRPPFHHHPTLENGSFLMVVGFLLSLLPHHPRKRAGSLIFHIIFILNTLYLNYTDLSNKPIPYPYPCLRVRVSMGMGTGTS